MDSDAQTTFDNENGKCSEPPSTGVGENPNYRWYCGPDTNYEWILKPEVCNRPGPC